MVRMVVNVVVKESTIIWPVQGQNEKLKGMVGGCEISR